MKTVIVTGSSEGIGLGLAKELLKKGCSVVLTSRTKAKLEAVYETLSKEYGSDKVMIQACNVSKIEEVQSLWDAAKAKFGTIDIFINNAGVSNSTGPVWAVDPKEMEIYTTEKGNDAFFNLFPVDIKDLESIADSGGVMPPKSTWFDPKLLSGLVLHDVGEEW